MIQYWLSRETYSKAFRKDCNMILIEYCASMPAAMPGACNRKLAGSTSVCTIICLRMTNRRDCYSESIRMPLSRARSLEDRQERSSKLDACSAWRCRQINAIRGPQDCIATISVVESRTHREVAVRDTPGGTIRMATRRQLQP